MRKKFNPDKGFTEEDIRRYENMVRSCYYEQKESKEDRKGIAVTRCTRAGCNKIIRYNIMYAKPTVCYDHGGNEQSCALYEMRVEDLEHLASMGVYPVGYYNEDGTYKAWVKRDVIRDRPKDKTRAEIKRLVEEAWNQE